MSMRLHLPRWKANTCQLYGPFTNKIKKWSETNVQLQAKCEPENLLAEPTGNLKETNRSKIDQPDRKNHVSLIWFPTAYMICKCAQQSHRCSWEGIIQPQWIQIIANTPNDTLSLSLIQNCSVSNIPESKCREWKHASVYVICFPPWFFPCEWSSFAAWCTYCCVFAPLIQQSYWN